MNSLSSHPYQHWTIGMRLISTIGTSETISEQLRFHVKIDPSIEN